MMRRVCFVFKIFKLYNKLLFSKYSTMLRSCLVSERYFVLICKVKFFITGKITSLQTWNIASLINKFFFFKLFFPRKEKICKIFSQCSRNTKRHISTKYNHVLDNQYFWHIYDNETFVKLYYIVNSLYIIELTTKYIHTHASSVGNL